MSAPDDVLMDILLRLPADCVIRFRCVSKHWSVLTRNPNFIAAHLTRSNSNDEDDDDDFSLICLLADNNEFSNDDWNYVISREDECASKLICLSGEDFRLRRDIEIPSRARDYCWPELSGSCNGILCLTYGHPREADRGIALWNPATGEVKLVPPIVGRWPLESIFFNRGVSIGFGYDSKMDDYKLLRLCFCFHDPDAFCYTHLYSLATDSWKELDQHLFVSNEPSEKAYVNGVFYWNDRDAIHSFDMVDEKFHEIPMPVVPFDFGKWSRSLVNWKGSLGLCADEMTDDYIVWFHIWVLNTDGESWTTLLKIATADLCPDFERYFLIGQRKHGEIIFLNQLGCGAWNIVFIDPRTQETRALGAPLKHPVEDCSLFYSYKASLVTLRGAVELDEHGFCNMVLDPYFDCYRSNGHVHRKL